jgi:hypothetical protein
MHRVEYFTATLINSKLPLRSIGCMLDLNSLIVLP